MLNSNLKYIIHQIKKKDKYEREKNKERNSKKKELKFLPLF
jgi:hypothetical protein